MTETSDKFGQAAEADVSKDDSGGEKPAPDQQQQLQIEFDESKALASYANFCRVTGTVEEMIIDFGLNSEATGVPTKPLQVSQRIVTNFYTAKRLLHALHTQVQRHEATFGMLETDVQKRIRSNVADESS